MSKAPIDTPLHIHCGIITELFRGIFETFFANSLKLFQNYCRFWYDLFRLFNLKNCSSRTTCLLLPRPLQEGESQTCSEGGHGYAGRGIRSWEIL
jgi:hypothetical protein